MGSDLSLKSFLRLSSHNKKTERACQVCVSDVVRRDEVVQVASGAALCTFRILHNTQKQTYDFAHYRKSDCVFLEFCLGRTVTIVCENLGHRNFIGLMNTKNGF